MIGCFSTKLQVEFVAFACVFLQADRHADLEFLQSDLLQLLCSFGKPLVWFCFHNHAYGLSDRHFDLNGIWTHTVVYCLFLVACLVNLVISFGFALYLKIVWFC